MRLVIDLQGAQGIGRARGIGRYSRELALAMARRSAAHDVIIALNGNFETESLRDEFAAILPRGNIRVWHGPDDEPEGMLRDPARQRVVEAIRAEFLASLRPDLVHVTSVFEGLLDDLVTVWPSWRTRPPIAATGYDLIPLIHRETYLDDPSSHGASRRWYLRCLQEMRLADTILAISASSKNEMIEHIGVEPEHVFNIRAGLGTEFRPLHQSVARRDAFLQRLGVRPDFILFVGGGDVRKNEAGLVRAYGRLPQSLRTRHQLVIVGKSDETALRSTARIARIDPADLVVIRFVDEADLPGLYGACELFVFPSLHEGFGLPAAEAMACGAPVIASNTTSLPEVVGRTDALFDPSDPAAIAERMRAVLENPAFRAELVSHAARQARQFTWPNSAARAWEALEATHDRLRQRPSGVSPPHWRLRLAFVSPIPPEQSGIADYSAELIPELARHYDITIVANAPDTSNEFLEPNFPIIDAAQFLAEADGFDRVLYQVGNSEFHADQLEDLLPRVPGVVALHDAYLSGVRNWVALNRRKGRAGFIEDLYRSHGWPAVLTAQRDGVQKAIHDFPCSLPVLQSAIGVIQHSRHGRDILAAHFGRAATSDIRIIPQLHQRFHGPERQAARALLGIPEDQFLVCSFGYVAPTKLPARLLSAWQAAGLAEQNARLVFVGQSDGAGARMLRAAAAARGQHVDLLWAGYVDAEAYRAWLAAADVAVQLRTGSRGETSRAILDCLAAGLATVVNDHGSAAELPDDAVVRLPADFTDATLAEVLCRLRDPAWRQRLAAKAREHVANNLSPRYVAGAFHAAIEAAYANGNAPARHRTTQSLSYALPPDGGSPEALAAIARALVRNFPTVQPSSLLIDISACPVLLPDDPLGALVAALLSTHAADIRVDLVSARHGRWHYARARAAALLGLSGAPAPDEPIDIAGAAALLCVIPANEGYTEASDQFRDLRGAGGSLGVLFAGPPPATAEGAMCGVATHVFALHAVDVDAINAWLARGGPGFARRAVAAASANALVMALSRRDGVGSDEAGGGVSGVARNGLASADRGIGQHQRRPADAQSASPDRPSIASQIGA